MRTRLLFVSAAACVMLTAVSCQQVARRQAIDHYVAGQLSADHGDMEAALAELARAVKADPDLSVAHCAMGDIYRQRGEYGMAKTCYQSACKANPYAFRPHYNLGVVFQILSDAAETIDQAEELLREAVAVYLRATTIEPDDFEANLNLGACYYSLGKFALAEKYCKAAILIEPDNPEAYSNLGVIFDSQDRPYEAIKAYKDSLELNVHQPKLLMNLGAGYLRQERLGAALQAFEMAVREAPRSAEAWEQLGTCFYHRREYTKALEAYRKAVSLDRQSAGGHRGLGVVYMTQYILDRKNTDLREKALAAWHTSLEIDPEQEDIVALVRKYSPKYNGPKL